MAYFIKFEYTILTAIWKDISIKPVKNYDAWFGYIQRTLSFLIFTFIKQLKENSDKKVMESETKSEWQSCNQLKLFWHWETNVINFFQIVPKATIHQKEIKIIGSLVV